MFVINCYNFFPTLERSQLVLQSVLADTQSALVGVGGAPDPPQRLHLILEDFSKLKDCRTPRNSPSAALQVVLSRAGSQAQLLGAAKQGRAIPV